MVLFLGLRSASNRPAPLTFITPQVENIEEIIEVSGNVAAQKTALLKFLGGGKLTYLGVKEGDEVVKNQRLASIDTRDLQKSLKETLNSYMIGRANLDEGRYDYKDAVYSESVIRALNSLQWTMDNTVLEVELKDLAIKNASLYAPFAGVVTKVPTNTAGMHVIATDAFEVADPLSLEFSGEVDEIDIGRVKVGQPVRIILDAYPQETIKATVASIAMKASASTKASEGTVFVVKAALPPRILHYRLGMNGTMKIVTKSATDALTIPLSSLIQKENQNFVRVKSGKNTAQEKEIQIGIESDEKVEVVSGLSASDQIVEVK